MSKLGDQLAKLIPLEFILDFEESVRAAGRLARTTVRDIPLGTRARPRIVGQLRTAMIENGLIDIAHQTGFLGEEVGVVEGTKVYLHQAFVQVGRIVAVRASMPAPGMLPNKNKSRKRLVEELNRHIDGSADLFEATAGKPSTTAPVAVFLLVCPDKRAEDGIGQIAIAIVDSRHDEFRFYETLEAFKSRYAPAPEIVEEPPLIARKQVAAFQPPEEASDCDIETDSRPG